MDDFAEVLKDGKNIFEYEYDPNFTIKDYIGRDIEFLIIQLVLEAYKKGLSMLTMGNLVKMNYWNTNEITSEIYEAHDDHWGIETLLLDTLIFVINDLRLGRVDTVALSNFSEAMDRIAENAVRSGYDLKNTAKDADLHEIGMKYSVMINSLLMLNKRYLIQKNEALNSSKVESLRYQMDGAERIVEDMLIYENSPLTDLVTDIPELIEVNFTINAKQAEKIQFEIEKSLLDFSNDVAVGLKINFAKQVENFCEYLNGLTLVANTINIPFSALSNNQFEAMKIMSFLKQKGTLDFIWNQNNYWHTTLSHIPITVDSLLGNKLPRKSIFEAPTKTKYNLSFSKEPCSLTFTNADGEKEIIAVQGQVQKEVLRVIFRKMDQAFDSWSLHDISEILGEDDVDVRAVKNAIYQFNRKVQSRLPHIKRLFDYNNDSAKLDKEYVSQS